MLLAPIALASLQAKWSLVNEAIHQPIHPSNLKNCFWHVTFYCKSWGQRYIWILTRVCCLVLFTWHDTTTSTIPITGNYISLHQAKTNPSTSQYLIQHHIPRGVPCHATLAAPRSFRRTRQKSPPPETKSTSTSSASLQQQLTNQHDTRSKQSFHSGLKLSHYAIWKHLTSQLAIKK